MESCWTVCFDSHARQWLSIDGRVDGVYEDHTLDRREDIH